MTIEASHLHSHLVASSQYFCPVASGNTVMRLTCFFALVVQLEWLANSRANQMLFEHAPCPLASIHVVLPVILHHILAPMLR